MEWVEWEGCVEWMGQVKRLRGGGVVWRVRPDRVWVAGCGGVIERKMGWRDVGVRRCGG